MMQKRKKLLRGVDSDWIISSKRLHLIKTLSLCLVNRWSLLVIIILLTWLDLSLNHNLDNKQGLLRQVNASLPKHLMAVKMQVRDLTLLESFCRSTLKTHLVQCHVLVNPSRQHWPINSTPLICSKSYNQACLIATQGSINKLLVGMTLIAILSVPPRLRRIYLVRRRHSMFLLMRSMWLRWTLKETQALTYSIQVRLIQLTRRATRRLRQSLTD